jgi:hypothetical protein
LGVLPPILAPSGVSVGPLPRYRCTLAAEPKLPNSVSAMPIFSNTHSIASMRPVVMAILGMLTASPSLTSRASRVGLPSGSVVGSAVVVQAASTPTGTLPSITKLPEASVIAPARTGPRS